MSLTPTAAPLHAGMLVERRAPVLVTGATGELGRAVVEELVASHVPVHALAHRRPLVAPGARGDARDSGVARHAAGDGACIDDARSVDESTVEVHTFWGDLVTGAGLDAALAGVGAVIHCAGDPRDARRVEVGGTRRVLEAVDAWAPGAHVVHVSLVGCFENPSPIHRAKGDAENVVEAWHGRASIVRATQFHPLVARLVRGTGAHVLGGVDDIAVRPVDPRWVATKLVDVASLRTSLTEPLELAGPETFTLAEAATLTAHLDRRRTPRSLPLPVVGSTMRAFRRGAHLGSASAQVGGRGYAEWVLAQG